MITDVILFIVGSFLKLLVSLFSLVSFTIPDWIETAIGNAFEYVAVLNGVFPIFPNPAFTGLAGSVGLFTIVGAFLQFLVAWYLIKLVLFVFGLIPWFGKHSKLPNHE